MRTTDADLVLVRHARPLLRHGEAAARWRIDPAAIVEVEALAHGLTAALPRLGDPTESIAIVASHEPKAAATARELARVWGRRSTQASGLEEHHRGPLPIVDDVTWRTTVARLFDHRETLVFGEETAVEAERRFVGAVAEVLAGASGRGERLSVIVSHATVMTLYLADANGLDSLALWGSLGLPEALLVRSSDRRLLGRIGPDGQLVPC